MTRPSLTRLIIAVVIAIAGIVGYLAFYQEPAPAPLSPAQALRERVKESLQEIIKTPEDIDAFSASIVTHPEFSDETSAYDKSSYLGDFEKDNYATLSGEPVEIMSRHWRDWIHPKLPVEETRGWFYVVRHPDGKEETVSGEELANSETAREEFGVAYQANLHEQYLAKRLAYPNGVVRVNESGQIELFGVEIDENRPPRKLIECRVEQPPLLVSGRVAFTSWVTHFRDVETGEYIPVSNPQDEITGHEELPYVVAKPARGLIEPLMQFDFAMNYATIRGADDGSGFEAGIVVPESSKAKHEMMGNALITSESNSTESEVRE